MPGPLPTADARAVRGAETRNRILVATRTELRRHGQDLTLDHVAARIALTKQAVLYHFPSKDRLLVELALLGLAEEADAMIAALAPARSAADAVHRFLRANLGFHLQDLERFRLIYVRAQVVPGAKDTLPRSERKARLYPVTARMYAALEEKLVADPAFSRHLDARTLAVAIHLAAIGYATMAGELEGAKDAMKLPFQRYVDELSAAITGGIARRRRRA
ncbi:MAG TPA: TetR/AcrR family transcriptional regulator [Polyangia bacterium]|nr:TetR/AcrR family transcriptional regulator [Polyangia bacterium]